MKESYEKKVAREESSHELDKNTKRPPYPSDVGRSAAKKEYSRTHSGGNTLGYLIKSINWVNS